MGLKVLTVHGWAFCPLVFKTLEGVGDVSHYRLGYTTLKEEAQRVAENIEENTLLVGWSLGATVAVLASTYTPPKGLVLIGATPHFGKAWKADYIGGFFKELGENFEGKVKEFRTSVWGEDICPLPPREGAVRLLKEFVETDLSETLKGLEIPVLILHGKKDFVTPFREAKKMLKLNPRFALTAYNGGHFPKDFTARDWKKLLEGLR